MCPAEGKPQKGANLRHLCNRSRRELTKSVSFEQVDADLRRRLSVNSILPELKRQLCGGDWEASEVALTTGVNVEPAETQESGETEHGPASFIFA
jgi:hypothetical protein